MKIIRTKPRDWKNIREGVYDVEHKTFEEGLQYEDIDFETFELNNTLNYILKDEKNIAGYLMSCPLENDTRSRKDKHFGKKDTIHLESVAVIPDYHGKGLGQKLFVRFLNDSKKLGFKRVVLDATSKSMVGLASKYGFLKVKFHKNWEGTRSAWYMEKIF